LVKNGKIVYKYVGPAQNGPL